MFTGLLKVASTDRAMATQKPRLGNVCTNTYTCSHARSRCHCFCSLRHQCHTARANDVARLFGAPGQESQRLLPPQQNLPTLYFTEFPFISSKFKILTPHKITSFLSFKISILSTGTAAPLHRPALYFRPSFGDASKKARF